jgi:DNA-binding NarL/FixJ family response regulator
VDVGLRCLIVDDNAGFLAAAGLLLAREGMDVVGFASTGDGAVGSAEELRPDVSLVDIDLGDESGFDVARRLKELADAAPVILISGDAEWALVDLVATSGALGFVAKDKLSASAIARLVELSR